MEHITVFWLNNTYFFYMKNKIGWKGKMNKYKYILTECRHFLFQWQNIYLPKPLFSLNTNIFHLNMKTFNK